MLHLWETLCRQLWLSGWLPWAPQGLMCWYLMALSSGAWYLTSPFYSISTWFFVFPMISSWQLLTLLFPLWLRPVACFYLPAIQWFYTFSFHISSSVHSGRMAAFATITPVPSPQNSDCFVRLWLLQMFIFFFSYWTEICSFMISLHWLSADSLRK